MKDEITVRVQRDFPNCQKYERCCKIDKPFWDELESKTKEIVYSKQAFRLQRFKIYHDEMPEGFEDVPGDFKND